MVKIVLIAMVCAILILYLKNINSELALLATIGSGIIILFFVFDYLAEIFEFINKLINLSGIDKNLYAIIFKTTAVGYLVEFSADTIRDFGLNSLAEKMIFLGKIIIFSMSLPIIYAVFNLLIGIMQ
jgi:stage III sporulation protein AD